jgi:hypothetical protein
MESDSRTVALARTDATNARKSRYSQEEIDVALSVLAFHCGNARKASEALEAQGRRVPESTLKLWRSDLYADRYRQIEEEELPRRYGRTAERFESIVESATGLEEALLEKQARELDDLPTRDVPGALRNVATAKAINVDKSLLLRGRPTEITATADVTELLKGLSQRYGGVVSVAAELVDETPAEHAPTD